MWRRRSIRSRDWWRHCWSTMPNSTLYAAVDEHFLAPDALKRAALLGRAGPDASGWFKAELAYLLDSLSKSGAIKAWRGNAPISEECRHSVDFRIEFAEPSATQDVRVLWLE